jgi:hypothetical protein
MSGRKSLLAPLAVDIGSVGEDPAWQKLLSLSILRAEEIVRVFDRLGEFTTFKILKGQSHEMKIYRGL